jgi:hypothetical protein
MAKQPKHGTSNDPLTRKQPEEDGLNPQQEKQPIGQSFYHQVGLKEDPGHGPEVDPPDTSTIDDKSDAHPHQAEGPGGKGPGAGM